MSFLTFPFTLVFTFASVSAATVSALFIIFDYLIMPSSKKDNWLTVYPNTVLHGTF